MKKSKNTNKNGGTNTKKQADCIWFSINFGNIERSNPYSHVYYTKYFTQRTLITTLNLNENDLLEGSRAELHFQLDSAINEILNNIKGN